MHTPLILLLAGLVFIPNLVFAQGTLQSLLANIPIFLSDIVIPFLFGIAFLFFVINVIRYFVIGGSSEEGREKAKDLLIYSIAAFVLLIIFWGLVNMLVETLGLGGETQPCPDYILQFDPSACP